MYINLKEKPKIENNFRLVCGWGEVIGKQPLVDEFFQLKVRNTLRLRRTVQVYERRLRKGMANEDDLGCGLCESELKDIELNEANSQLRWVKVNGGHPDVQLKSQIILANETYIGPTEPSDEKIPEGSYKLS